MHRQPAAIDGEFHAAAIFRRTAAIAKQKRLVDLLNVDAALNRLDQVSDFDDSPRGFLRVGVGAGGGGISCSSLVSLSAPRATILIASSVGAAAAPWFHPTARSFGAGKSAVS